MRGIQLLNNLESGLVAPNYGDYLRTFKQKKKAAIDKAAVARKARKKKRHHAKKFN